MDRIDLHGFFLSEALDIIDDVIELVLYFGSSEKFYKLLNIQYN